MIKRITDTGSIMVGLSARDVAIFFRKRNQVAPVRGTLSFTFAPNGGIEQMPDYFPGIDEMAAGAWAHVSRLGRCASVDSARIDIHRLGQLAPEDTYQALCDTLASILPEPDGDQPERVSVTITKSTAGWVVTYSQS